MRITAHHVTKFLSKFHQVYENGKEINPVPNNTPCIVYFSKDSTVNGWLEIKKHEDMGLEALIARSWITKKELEQLILKA